MIGHTDTHIIHKIKSDCPSIGKGLDSVGAPNLRE